jgi:hypothetical protein
MNTQSAKIAMPSKVANTAQRLAQEHSKDKPKKAKEEVVPKEYHKYLRIFDKKASNRFPPKRPWDHAINMKPGFQPKNCKIYPMAPMERTSLDDWINEQEGKGYIQKSKSPQASPFFFIGKKEANKLQPIIDYWYVNEWTEKNAYPIPLIPEVIDKLEWAEYFTKMDVWWGYNNIRIKEGDEWKAAFKTSRGLFEPTVMFFGLCKSPATFQAMMNHIFQDLIDQGVVVVYMDDILIFTKMKEEHKRVTYEVLKILEDNDFYLKPEKCEFEKKKIEYLGLIIKIIE